MGSIGTAPDRIGARPCLGRAATRALGFFILIFATAFAVEAHGYSAPGSVSISLDTGAGEAGFQSVVYVQNVKTGQTLSFPYPPHAPPLLVYVPEPGTYVFYARLVEAMDDYFFGYTGMLGRGPSPKRGLLAIDIEAGKGYKVLLNDRAVLLPEKGRPVIVPWRR